MMRQRRPSRKSLFAQMHLEKLEDRTLLSAAYEAQASVHGGYGTGGAISIDNTGSSPVSADEALITVGNGWLQYIAHASAAADEGLDGASAAGNLKYGPAGLGGIYDRNDATAHFSYDDVVISGPPGTVTIPLNLSFGGSESASAYNLAGSNSLLLGSYSATAGLDVSGHLGSNGFSGSMVDFGLANNQQISVIGGVTRSGILSGGGSTITTGALTVPTNTPLAFNMWLHAYVVAYTSVVTTGPKQPVFHFQLYADGTLSFPLSGPVFNLPAGYTVNSAEAGIVNNLFVAQPVSLAVSGLPSSMTAGTPESFTVTAVNSLGNPATGYTGTVHFRSTDPKAVLPADYTFTSADAGVHTFSTTLKTAGNQSITAGDTMIRSLTASQPVTVSPAATSHFKITVPASTTAGIAFSITVTAFDPYGNITPGYTGTVHFSSSDKKAVLPSDYAFTGTDAGVHMFISGVTLKTAGSQTVTATDTVTATITGKSAAIKVSAAAVDHLKITAVASATAGTAFSITVTVQDAFNNTVTNYLGTIHFTSTDLQAVLPADYTFTATDKGVHTFTSGVILKTAGTQTVTVTDNANSTLTGSASIKVAAAKANPCALPPRAASRMACPSPSRSRFWTPSATWPPATPVR